ncbi:MAG: ATP-binding cassette domain-containing protein [Actinomycetaceae bacterium]|nr:ATP-binding cassette domain-containing protein [Actinomycetaceae bacterium]
MHICWCRTKKYRDYAYEVLSGLGIDNPKQKCQELSGGQAQRVALARALLLNPSVIYADEPTGNLDSESAEIVMSRLKECAENGAAVVVVTHDDRVTAQCDMCINIGGMYE